jgi:hypothetical protein
MKKSILFHCVVSFALTFTHIHVNAQGVAINTTGNPADASAILDVNSTQQGFAVPRMTEEQRDAISNPVLGLQVFNTTSNCLNLWVGTTWKQICGDCDFNVPVLGNNGPMCEGGTIQLTASTIPDATYLWTGPNGFSSSLQNPEVENTTASSGGLYSVTATKDGCTSQAQFTSVTVYALPDAPAAGNDGPACEGSTAQLTCGGVSGATYAWTGPGGFTSSQQNPVIDDIQLSQDGLYEVTTTVNGCVSAAASTDLIVIPLPSSAFTPTTGIEDATVFFAAAESGAAYQWSFTSGTPATSTSETPSVIWSAVGSYNVTLTVTADGCSSTTTTPVTISTPTVVTLSTPGSTSWTAPTGVTSVTVIVIGGGGGGGAGGGGTAGGGGGGYAKSIETVVPGQSYPIVVGAGGLESTTSSWWLAQSGGASSFNGTVVANGGTGANNEGTRKNGGTATGGNVLNLTGGYGGASNEAGGNGPTGGGGGYNNFSGGVANQPYGGNGGNGVSNNSVGGENGYSYGGGGGGGHSRPTGVPNAKCRGANGAVILIY